MHLRPLPRSFFDREPAEVARLLLGKLLVRRVRGRALIGKIVETEAYLPAGDAASHSFKGRSARNASMYKEAGHAYVHGMRQYFLLDIVTQGTDKPGGVLIRAVEPVAGLTGKSDGPGKLCAAFGITRALDGADMTNPASKLFVADNPDDTPAEVAVSARVGISKAKELALRFYIVGNTHVSKPR